MVSPRSRRCTLTGSRRPSPTLGWPRSSLTIGTSEPAMASRVRRSIPGRRCVWGSSYSGGHVLVLGAIDRRVRCVVSQVPLISGHANFRALVRADFIAGFREQFNADRAARYRGEPPAMVPVVAEDPL